MPSSFLRILLWLSLALGVLVGVARVTCLRWWQVPEDDPVLSASLAPTLRAGDWVILWRLTPPGFGDLVLCPDPSDATQIVIGRIVGQAGDTMEIDDEGNLRVNNLRLHSDQSCDHSTFEIDHPRSGDPVELQCDIETVGGVHHQRAYGASGGLRPIAVNTKVPQGRLFLVSDNRQYPFDSRQYGAVPEASCSEAIVFRLVSRLGFRNVESRLTIIH
jgi:signal peptidase I